VTDIRAAHEFRSTYVERINATTPDESLELLASSGFCDGASRTRTGDLLGAIIVGAGVLVRCVGRPAAPTALQRRRLVNRVVAHTALAFSAAKRSGTTGVYWAFAT
jgi:hypothetical protein